MIRREWCFRSNASFASWPTASLKLWFQSFLCFLNFFFLLISYFMIIDSKYSIPIKESSSTFFFLWVCLSWCQFSFTPVEDVQSTIKTRDKNNVGGFAFTYTNSNSLSDVSIQSFLQVNVADWEKFINCRSDRISIDHWKILSKSS